MRRLRLPLLLLAAATCLTAAAPKGTTASLPTYTSAYEPTTVDERGLWMEFDEIERTFRDSPLVIRDEALDGYVRRVLCHTVGSDRCKSVRPYVVQEPTFNASMAPNGMMIIHSGLLMRARNEAELAAVLGHEFAHFELRHSLNRFKQRRLAGDLIAWAGAIGGISGTNVYDLQWSLYGSTFSFSRAQEEEADMLGLKYLGASPYPAMAASEIWQHLMAENDATAAGRKRKPRRRYFAAFFDTHPTELKRALYLHEQATKMADAGDVAAAGHRQGISSQLPLFLGDQVKLNDFGGTEYILGELAKTSGWSGELLFARGELYRQRGNPRDLVSAAQFYSDAIAEGYAPPEARRNLGLSLLRGGHSSEGKAALEEYLRIKPDASDAKAISALLAN